MIRTLTVIAIAVVTTTPAGPGRHIELVRSSPAVDAVVGTPPGELVLTFNTELDYDESAVTLRGPDGPVELTDRVETANHRALSVGIEGEMPDGRYTVSWTATPLDDHGGRGRFKFELHR